MIFGSVCTGIGAAEVAWQSLGWQCAFTSEIDKFPRAVLEHRLGAGSPNGIPLHGDFTTIEADQYGTIDVLVGGTPCQAFSVAGLRGGLDDARGNLALEYFKLVKRKQPRIVVWENVPGVYSSNEGRDFGAILGALEELGYGWAYRTLDAQYVRVDGFGRAIPQRRRRCFVVGYFGDWRRAAAILFDAASLRRDPAPRRGEGEGNTAGTLRSTDGGSDLDHARAAHLIPAVANPLTHRMHKGVNTTMDEGQTMVGEVADPLTAAYAKHGGRTAGKNGAVQNLVAFTAKDHGADADTGTAPTLRAGAHDGVGVRDDGAAYTLEARQTAQAVAFQPRFARNDRGGPSEVAYPLTAEAGRTGKGDSAQAVAFKASHFTRGKDGAPSDVTPPLSADADRGDQDILVVPEYKVRRLTPRECERLQGFSDDWTAIPWRGKPAERCPDGPRYKALGNAMAVNCMRWIGQRIDMLEKLSSA